MQYSMISGSYDGGILTPAKLSNIQFDARWSPARVMAEARCTIRAVFDGLRLVRWRRLDVR